MRLTLDTDYALRVLLYVGLKRDGLTTVTKIVRHFDIPRGHAMKVVRRLGLSRYLQTIQDKRGGMRLTRWPSEISVRAVVRDMEHELGVIGCLQDKLGYCRIQECCRLRIALREATNALLSTLDRYTIADLLQPRQLLFRLLQIGDAGPPPSLGMPA
jgi:Rrf2 family transcriptional regulator, nitric oxide-sensitive transcriptional repressor